MYSIPYKGLARKLSKTQFYGLTTTNVFQEENVVAFNRSHKLDLARLRAIQQRPAVIEQQR